MRTAKRSNKYSARRTTLDGIKFDSKREAKRWAELCLLERAGEIADLRRQVVLELEGRDGPLLTRTGLTVYEDAKGVPTRDYQVRRAVAAAQDVEIIET